MIFGAVFGLCLSAASASADAEAKDFADWLCTTESSELQRTINHSNIDPDFADQFIEALELICEAYQSEKWDHDKVYAVANALHFRLTWCREDQLNSSLFDKVFESPLLKSTKQEIAFNHFCYTTYDEDRYLRSKNSSIIIERQEWLKRERICHFMSEFADPSDFFIQYFIPETDAQIKLKKQSAELCRQLRAKEIDFQTAIYEWDLAAEEFRASLPPEILKKMTPSLKGLFDIISKSIGLP